MNFPPAEAAFLFGKNHGLAVRHSSVASGATLRLSRNNQRLTVRGTERQRARAKKYIGLVIAQMDTTVYLNDEHIDDDCSLTEVPGETVGWVTGEKGKQLRKLEEDCGVVALFAEYSGKLLTSAGAGQEGIRCETLAVYGPKRNRRAAQLAVMSMAEEKVPRFYSARMRSEGETYDTQDADEDWGTTTMEIAEAIMPYAVGKNACMKKKLSQSSGAAVAFMGNLAVMSGTLQERTRCKEYLTWTLQTLEGPLSVADLQSRTDVTEIPCPAAIVGFVKGTRREALSRHEMEWGVMIFFAGEHGQRGSSTKEAVPDTVPLLIFGQQRGRQGAEIDVMCSMEYKQKGCCSSRLEECSSDSEGFALERILFSEAEVSYALGVRGCNRRKIASAAGAIMNFVGQFCCIAGTWEERQRCKSYLHFHLSRMDNLETAIDTRGRTDVTEITFSNQLGDKGVGVVTGKGGKTLQWVSSTTETWCVVAADHTGAERLCIFSHKEGNWNDETGRKKAERMFREVLAEGLKYHRADLARDKAREEREKSREKSRSRPPMRSRSHQSRSAPPRRSPWEGKGKGYGKGDNYGKGYGKGDGRGWHWEQPSQPSRRERSRSQGFQMPPLDWEKGYNKGYGKGYEMAMREKGWSKGKDGWAKGEWVDEKLPPVPRTFAEVVAGVPADSVRRTWRWASEPPWRDAGKGWGMGGKAENSFGKGGYWRRPRSRSVSSSRTPSPRRRKSSARRKSWTRPQPRSSVWRAASCSSSRSPSPPRRARSSHRPRPPLPPRGRPPNCNCPACSRGMLAMCIRAQAAKARVDY